MFISINYYISKTKYIFSHKIVYQSTIYISHKLECTKLEVLVIVEINQKIEV